MKINRNTLLAGVATLALIAGSGFASAEAHVEYLAELAAALRGRGWLSTEDAIATGPSPHGET